MSERIRGWWLLIALMAFTSNVSAEERPKVLLIGQSPDGHPRATHEYMAGVELMAKCLRRQATVDVQVVRADDPWLDGPELLKAADGAVLFVSEGAKWIHSDSRRLVAFAQLAARGGGLTTLHWAMGTREAQYIDGYLKLFGGCHGGPDRKYKVVDSKIVVAATDHPSVHGIRDFPVHEEFYYRLKFIAGGRDITNILKTKIEGQDETVCWAWQRPDGGRSFGFSGGHFHDNWKHEEYRRLMSQGILWTVKQTIPKDGLAVDVAASDLQLESAELKKP